VFNYCVFEKNLKFGIFLHENIFSTISTHKDHISFHLAIPISYNVILIFSKTIIPTKSPFVVPFFGLVGRILKHGFACSKTCYIDKVLKRLSHEEYCLYSIPPFKKGQNHHKKRRVLHNSLLTSQ
jgi:hypothetical protein